MTQNEIDAIISLLRSYFEVAADNLALCASIDAAIQKKRVPAPWLVILERARASSDRKSLRLRIESFLSNMREVADEKELIAKILQADPGRPPD